MVTTNQNTSHLKQGNAAMQNGDYVAAAIHYLHVMQHSPVLGKNVATNLVLARGKYRRELGNKASKRVGVCGWELAHNAAGRVYTLAQIYQSMGEEVEIIGAVFPEYGGEIWEPVRKTSIAKHIITVKDESRFVEQAMQLVASHPYDIVHLSKPRIPNIFFGILYKLIWDAKVIMDIDDEELTFVGAEKSIQLDDYLKTQGALPALKNLDGRDWTRIAVGLATSFDGVTVSNPALQKRYGGEIIRHARDENHYQPSPELKRQSRQKFGIPQDKKVVLFFGTPRQHKGLQETAKAIAALNRNDIVFAIVGAFDNPAEKKRLQEISGVDCIFIGNQPFDKIGEVVAVGDYCVLLQDPHAQTSLFQVPAKLSDALAMGLVVLAEPTPALADLADQGAFVPTNADNLSRQLGKFLGDPGSVARQQTAGHNAYLAELSFAKNTQRLQDIKANLVGCELSDDAKLFVQTSDIAFLHGLGRFGASQPAQSGLQESLKSDGVSLIILNLDGAQLLERFLDSFFKNNTYSRFEMIIVDHGSTDESSTIVDTYKSKAKITFINRGKNYSFSSSCNFGAAKAAYPNLLFINNDIFYSEDVLHLAVAKLMENNIAAVGIRLDHLRGDNAQQTKEAVQHAGIEFEWNENRDYLQPVQLTGENEGKPGNGYFPAVTGAFMLCRKDDFEAVKGFNEDYYYGLEDVDLCLKFGFSLNKKIFCLNEVGLKHIEGETRFKSRHAIPDSVIEKNHDIFKGRWSEYIKQSCGQHIRRHEIVPTPKGKPALVQTATVAKKTDIVKRRKYSQEDLELVRKSLLFNANWYRNKYLSNGAKSSVDPAEDFLDNCVNHLRNPSELFSTQYYLKTYPDISKHRLIPFLHYLKSGSKEGRKPLPAQAREMPDEFGNLRIPNRQVGDGKKFISISQNKEHYWYKNNALDDYLANLDSQPLLPETLRRLLFIAHDFKLTTGVSRPISHYLNAMSQSGGYELTSIELAKDAIGKIASSDIDSHDFVVVNSFAPFIYNPGLLHFVSTIEHSKIAIYLHETNWGFDKMQTDFPEIYNEFVAVAPLLNFFCVSGQQAQILKDRFKARNCYVVYNTTHLATISKKEKDVTRSAAGCGIIKIVMAGTIQPRKGVDLFSKVADRAKDLGLPWEFIWAGWEADANVYKSPNVDFVGNLSQKELTLLLDQSDIFFLSSIDDPFPLSCLEAFLLNKKVVIYKDCGISEIIDQTAGTAVYREHSVESAFAAIKEAVNTDVDIEAYKQINRDVSLESFVNRMNVAISDIYNKTAVAPVAANTARVCVHLHLFYHELWYEMRSYLNNLNHINFDLFVTLSNEHPIAKIDEMERVILKTHPDATILRCDNRGMDVGPFIAVANHVIDNNLKYDYLLKIHTKKSLAASGEEKGAEWRNSLLDGLLGTPSIVDQVISIFADENSVGMIGPHDMLISKSTRDVKAGKNLNMSNMDYMADRLHISYGDPQSFFRGTMFWARADIIFNQLKKYPLLIEDFDFYHQVDETRAHAMERLFPAIVENHNKSLYRFNKTMPKGIELLKNKHQGRDIYVIAAGASCDYLDPSLFDGKITIGINRVFNRYRCDYVVMKEFGGKEWSKGLFKKGTIPIVAKWHSGNILQGNRRLNYLAFNNPSCHFFDHLENTREIVNLSVIEKSSDKLVVSYSTITSGIHLAAYMGARNIILVGHDCGSLDGKSSFDGYYKDVFARSPWDNTNQYAVWLGTIEAQTIEVRDRVKDVYGCNILSLNPFVNFGLEGHDYDRTDK